jgi:hypothetical protein
MSVAKRSRSKETWSFAWKMESSPKARFLIHNPGVGKTAAMP